MLLQSLKRLWQNECYIYYSQCPNSSQGGCGEKNRVSCMSGCSSSSCPCDLGGYDICKLNWVKVCSCECSCSNHSYDRTSTSPTQVSASFLNSPCVPCDFRARPTYLKCEKCIGSKYYVLLGVSCVGDVAFELDSHTTCENETVYHICRVSFICN